jgi:dienelactone hydrolase
LAQSDASDFRAAAMFYPTVRRPHPYGNALPVLVLQGTADNVTPEADLRSFLAARSAASSTADVVALVGASHGFDVPSLEPARTIRFPPLIGQRVTFGYNAEAAGNAYSALDDFLRREGVIGGACSGE